VELPIQLVSKVPSMKFKWRQTVTTPLGTHSVEHIGSVPLPLQGALVDLILLAGVQAKELEKLRSAKSEASSSKTETKPPVTAKRK
jgi:hypothetical protein